MLCSTFGKADILENKALYQNLIYMSVRRPFHAPTDRPFKNFHHAYNDLLWRHILPEYDFYSRVNWNDIVTTLMRQIKIYLFTAMQDMTAFYYYGCGLQYGLSAKD